MVYTIYNKGGNMRDYNHLLINARIENSIIDKRQAVNFLNNLVHDLNMKSVSEPSVNYIEKTGVRGIFGSIVVEDGHMTFHILDEKNPAIMQFDLYIYADLPLSSVMYNLGKYFDVIYLDYALINREIDIRIRAHGRITNKKD